MFYAEGFVHRDNTSESCVCISEYPKLTHIKCSFSFLVSLIRIFTFLSVFLLLLSFSVHVITLPGIIDALFVRRKIAELCCDIVKDLQALLLSPALSHYELFFSFVFH